MGATTRNYSFKVDIDCADCARKVEEHIGRSDKVEKVDFNYAEGRLSVTTTLSRKEIMELAREVEDEIEFLDRSSSYIFNVEIDCADCARKVEEHLKKDLDIESASFNYSEGKLYVNTALTKAQVKELCREVEDDIEFLEDEKTFTFDVEIDCADCARKVEDALRRHENISSALFDFPQGKLTVTTSLGASEIKRLCLAAEEDMKFLSRAKNSENEKTKRDLRPYRIIIAIVVMALSSFFSLEYLVLLAYLLAGYDVLLKAIRNIGKGKLFDENFLMGIATVGAVVLGQYMEAAAVMVFYQVGEYFQDRAVRRSRRSIKALMDLSPESCTVIRNGNSVEVEPEEVAVGETIVVKAGERVALDGIVSVGESYLDTSSITGESVRRSARKGTEVLSGSVNTSGVLEILVTRNYENSTTSRILDMVENNSDRKAQTERFITRFARYYTPIVCLLSLVIAFVPPFFGVSWSVSVYRALMLLVVSCPCALVLSVPLSYFASIGAFAKAGILVKGAESIQKLSRLSMMAFDKTGTLTKGTFSVQKVVNSTDVDILPYLIALERNSDHPIAKAICEKGTTEYKAEDVHEIAGFGVSGIIDGREYTVAKPSYFGLEVDEKGSVAVLGCDRKVLGHVVISDELKDGIHEALSSLRKVGVDKLVMLTGDRKEAASKMAETLGLDKVVSDLLPDEKVRAFESERSEGICGFAGDGINDAVLLSTADVGIAMGGVGSDAAIEAADIIIMNDDIARISKGVRISRKTERIVRENIFFALAVKFSIIVLAILGVANMWLAIFGDVGVALLCVMNAMRCLSVDER